MSAKRLYIFYFMYGAIGSITAQMLPLVLTDKGYTLSQVSIALSFVFLAALFQPLIGYLTKIRFGSKRMLELLLILLIIMAVIIFAVTNFVIMLFTILLYSIARLSISPLYDSYATMAGKVHNINYGLVRSGASLGFGTGMAIYTIIANYLGLEYSASFVVIAITGSLGLYVMTKLPHEQIEQQHNEALGGETNLKRAVLLILMYMLYFGALNIRISYMSMYYVEFGYTTSFISLATFFLVIPEVIFLPLYNRLFSKYNKVLLMVISIFLGIIQMLLYIFFSGYPLILLFACLFNGFQIMIFFPTYFGMLQDSLGPKNSSFGFVMNYTMQSLFVGVFNLIFIRPVFVAFNSIIPVFIMVIGLQLIAFIPLGIYHLRYNKNKC